MTSLKDTKLPKTRLLGNRSARYVAGNPIMSTQQSLVAVADEVGSDNEYTPNKAPVDQDSDDSDNYEEDDAFDADAGASALLSRAGKPTSPKRGHSSNNDGASAVDQGSNRLVAAAQGSTALWAQLYGSAYQKQQYYPAVVLRKNRDDTYNVKFKNGDRKVGLTKRAFKLTREEREDKRFGYVQGDRVLCKKKSAPSKSRMNEMSVPTCLRKAKTNRKFSSDEDAAECTFAPKLKKKTNKEGESKDNQADFLIRMEAKENARRVELERKRFEAKRTEQKRRKGAKKSSDEDVALFLNRLAKQEEKKKQRYKKLEKELRPSFNITERQMFDESTGKIITVPVEKTKPDTAAFLARLEVDAMAKQEKAKRRAMNATIGSPSRRSPSAENSMSEYSNTMY